MVQAGQDDSSLLHQVLASWEAGQSSAAGAPHGRWCSDQALKMWKLPSFVPLSLHTPLTQRWSDTFGASGLAP